MARKSRILNFRPGKPHLPRTTHPARKATDWESGSRMLNLFKTTTGDTKPASKLIQWSWTNSLTFHQLSSMQNISIGCPNPQSPKNVQEHRLPLTTSPTQWTGAKKEQWQEWKTKEVAVPAGPSQPQDHSRASTSSKTTNWPLFQNSNWLIAQKPTEMRDATEETCPGLSGTLLTTESPLRTSTNTQPKPRPANTTALWKSGRSKTAPRWLQTSKSLSREQLLRIRLLSQWMLETGSSFIQRAYSRANAEPSWITECWLLATALRTAKTTGLWRIHGEHLGAWRDIFGFPRMETEKDSAVSIWRTPSPLLD